MSLAYKQLARQILRNRIFVALLLILTILTSLSFFFVRFSIDGNMAVLNGLPSLTENQQLYHNALGANMFLAYNFLASLTALTAFVFAMFFYRFFRSDKKQIGCLKSLGFKDKSLRLFFVVFVAALSMIGALLGLFGGYFLSSVLVNANMQTYAVTGLVKDISIPSAAIGLLASTAAFCVVAYLCYGFVSGKEAGALVFGSCNSTTLSGTLKIADKIAGVVPIKNKSPLRIALRKPLAILLIFIAVMAFSVCMILGRSLNISSQVVFESQTVGHDYEYDVKYPDIQFGDNASQDTIQYLSEMGSVVFGSHNLEQNIIALHSEASIFMLQDKDSAPVALPENGETVVGNGIVETYGLRVGDTITVSVGGRSVQLTVRAVAANAKSASIYMNAAQMAAVMELPVAAFNGELCSSAPADAEGAEIIGREQRIDDLNRNAVSNNISAIINQATGVLVGCILLFLALYVNFQDNTRDMLILHMMGYRIKAICKLLINIYLPIVWVAFFVTLAPSIFLAKAIQQSLSISTNDYMPFDTNVLVILIALLVVTLLYQLVQMVFSIGVKRVIAKEEVSDVIYVE